MTTATPLHRLDFRLPDFVRTTWVSEHARTVWEPRIASVATVWQKVEWWSVVDGVRSCALLAVTEDALDALAPDAAQGGLALVPVDRIRAGPYSAARAEPAAGEASQQRVVAGRPADVAAFRDAWARDDQERIGGLLGYPACCTAAFIEVWVDQQLIDPTWPMALRVGTEPTDRGAQRTVTGPPEANVLLRWLGLRAVPHLPCSFACEATGRFGAQLLDVARGRGHAAEAEDLLRMLDWPVEWSALHGIAEVRTPVVKLSVTTDATATAYVVRRPGGASPDEGAAGLAFPYQPPRKHTRAPTTTVAGRQSSDLIALDRMDRLRRQPWYWGDNGFSSLLELDAAHRPIVALAAAALRGTAGAVLDLGCGNGTLLEKVAEAAPGVTVHGLDRDPERIAHAEVVLADRAAELWAGDLLTAEAPWEEGRRYDLVILMPGRFNEAGPVAAARLRGLLAERAERLLLYVYPGYRSELDLAGLATTAGLVIDPDADPSGPALGKVG